VTGASAGAVNISSCQTLSTPTVYKLTTDISDSGCGDCLVVGANKVTINLQGHSIVRTGACARFDSAILDDTHGKEATKTWAGWGIAYGRSFGGFGIG
jgi:hypothetical protein